MFVPKTTWKHVNCCAGIYLNSSVKRFTVPTSLVDWNTAFADYNPPYYDSPVLIGKSWADPVLGAPSFVPKWNRLDGYVDRRSHQAHEYAVDELSDCPINPVGRTGLRGRGLLGRWGPNHAADPIITRWKQDFRSGEFETHGDTKRKILQLVTIQRRDNHMWALPGGMVDPGEHIGQTLRREFMEEAMNTTDMPEQLEKLFGNGGDVVYNGYVDDHRNTDNAWMETVARNFHDADGSCLAALRLEAGDDAGAVRWTDVSGAIVLYASHKMFVEMVAQKLNAHW